VTINQMQPLRRAAQLRAVLENQQVPAVAEGTDAAGTVRVVLGPDGLPTEIRVLGPPAGRLGAAVEEAFAAASAQRWRTWPGLDAGRPVDVPVDRPPEPAASARPLGEIAEDVIAGLLDRPAPGPDSAVPVASDGRIVLALSFRSGVRCACDDRWVGRQDATALDAALAEALQSARADLARTSSNGPDPWGPLLSEALAAFAALDPDR
jgi:hypothetical protein